MRLLYEIKQTVEATRDKRTNELVQRSLIYAEFSYDEWQTRHKSERFENTEAGKREIEKIIAGEAKKHRSEAVERQTAPEEDKK
jgi:hypothetical protein